MDSRGFPILLLVLRVVLPRVEILQHLMHSNWIVLFKLDVCLGGGSCFLKVFEYYLCAGNLKVSQTLESSEHALSKKGDWPATMTR